MLKIRLTNIVLTLNLMLSFGTSSIYASENALLALNEKPPACSDIVKQDERNECGFCIGYIPGVDCGHCLTNGGGKCTEVSACSGPIITREVGCSRANYDKSTVKDDCATFDKELCDRVDSHCSWSVATNTCKPVYVRY